MARYTGRVTQETLLGIDGRKTSKRKETTEDLEESFSEANVNWSDHALERMQERNISVKNVLDTIHYGYCTKSGRGDGQYLFTGSFYIVVAARQPNGRWIIVTAHPSSATGKSIERFINDDFRDIHFKSQDKGKDRKHSTPKKLIQRLREEEAQDGYD